MLTAGTAGPDARSKTMKLVLIRLVTAATLGAAVVSLPTPGHAGGGDVAAGIIGGLAVGTILGAATAPRPSVTQNTRFAVERWRRVLLPAGSRSMESSMVGMVGASSLMRGPWKPS